MKPLLHAVPQPEFELPYYVPAGNECALFELAWRKRLPLLLKGPTGCGKTRFVAHMASNSACRSTLSPATTISRPLISLAATFSRGRYGLGGRTSHPRRARGRHLLPR